MANATSSENYVKNVAVVGAGGQVGTPITKALLETGKHNVTALSRAGSTNVLPAGVKTATVDYDDHASLVNALRGQDALVVTMNVLAPPDSVAKIVEAGIEAGVAWILPNEWGSDYLNPEINKDTGLGEDKLSVRRLIASKGGEKISWIAVACGFWYEYSMAAGNWTFGFDFTKKEALYYDDGNFTMTYSTLGYCGQAVAKLLSLPIVATDDGSTPCLNDYRNQIVPIHAFRLNQKDMLASILRVTGDKESDWTIKHVSSEERYNEGKKILQNGNRMGFRLILYARMFYPSNPTRSLEDFEDERLGLQAPTLDSETKWAINEALKA